MSPEFECVVVGGGAAGLSGALALGRARRRTLLLDIGGQSNLVADGIGGLLGNDRRPPADLYAAGREEIAAYGSVEVREVEARDGGRRDDGFALELADASEVAAKTVLLATGMDYRLPELAGAAERWGHSVFHCPFCHGWEVRGKPLAALGTDDAAVHRALLLRAWSEDVALLTDGGELDGDAADRLAAVGVEVEERPLAALRGPAPALECVVFRDGSERPLGGLLVPVTLTSRSDLAQRLGAEPARDAPMHEGAVVVDARMGAGVPGLFAAGDVLPRAPSVPAAIASGAAAGGAMVGFLTN